MITDVYIDEKERVTVQMSLAMLDEVHTCKQYSYGQYILHLILVEGSAWIRIDNCAFVA